MRGHVQLAAALVAIAVLAGACAPAGGPRPTAPDGQRGQPAAPRRLTAAIKSAPTYISDKVFAGAGGFPGAQELEKLLNAGLMTEDNQDVRRAQLAEALPTIENGLWKVFPDGRMETTWKIREGVRWHDGTPFTADDILFTARIEQDRDLAIPPAVIRAYRLIDGIEAPDSRTVVIRWRAPFIDADDMFESPVPRHLLERQYTDDKARLPELLYWTESYVGTGPYKLRTFVRDSHLTVEANPDYALGRPKIDEIVVKFITDSNTMGANILAGEVSLTMGRGLSFSEAIHIRDQWRDGKLEIAFNGWYAMYPQSINPTPPVGDVRFRRAVMHAIDRQQLADTLQSGLVPPAHGYVPPSAPEYRDIENAIIRYDFDSRRAAQLIEEIGYTRGPDNFYRDAANRRLQVEVRSAADPDIDANSNLAVHDFLERVGVGVDSEIYSRQRGRDVEYRATHPGFQLQRQPNELNALVRFQSAQVPLPENNWVGENKGRYANPELDSLIDRFFSTIPRPERMQALGQIVRHMTDRLHVMGLFYDGEPTMIGSQLTNVYALHVASNSHEWGMR